MKKNYFKLLLLTVLMCVGGNAWAQTTLYEKSSWSSSDLDDWTAGSIGTSGLEVTNGVSSSTTITPSSDTSTLTWTVTWNPGNATGTANNTNAYISFGDVAFKFYGSSWRTDASIGGTTTSLQAGYTRLRDYSFEVTINQATKTVSYSYTDNGTTVNGTGTISNVASSYNLTLGLGGKSPSWTNTATLKSVSIIETENTATFADYTVKYVCDGEEIKEAVTRQGEVGSDITLLDTDKETFYASDNSAKYVYSSDDASSVTVAADGSAVVTVTFTKSNSYEYIVTSSLGVTIAEGVSFEGDAVTVYWNKYVKDGDTWYETEAPYGVVITEATNKTVTYTEAVGISYVFEAGAMSKSRAAATNISGTAYSGGWAYGHYSSSSWWSTEIIAAGKYDVVAYAKSRRSGTTNILISSRDADGNLTETGSSLTWTNTGTEDIIMSASEVEFDGTSYFALVEATGSNCVSYIDYVVLKEHVTAVPVTFSETNGADITVMVDGEAYDVSKKYEVGEYSFTATAEGYEDYEGTFSVTSDDLSVGSKTVEFTMLSATDVKSITVEYVYNDEIVASEAYDMSSLTENPQVGDSFTVPFRAYVSKDGKLYQTRNNGSNPYYGDEVALEKNTVVTKTVSEVDLGGGTLELFDDLDASTGNNASIRASYMSAYDNKAYTSSEVLPAGVYTFIVRYYGRGRGSVLKVGDTTVKELTTKSWTTETSTNVIVPEDGILTLVAGPSKTYDPLDIVIAIRTGDLQPVNIAVTSAGYKTFCSEYDIDLSNAPEGFKASIITDIDADGNMTLEDITNVPANTGILIEAPEGEYGFYGVNPTAAVLENNLLVGVLEATQVAGPIYVLMDGEEGVGLYKTGKTFTVGANTAYIPGDKVQSGVKALAFGDGTTTAINGVETESLTGRDAVIYNLAGQRVAAPAKGIYIVNGKKVMFK